MKAIRRRTIVKDILWVIATIGLVAVIARFTRGLGATTALNDATPWGLWKIFNVVAGIPLAAGGFTIAATIHIFHMKRYRPILRLAILTALLGYGTAIIGLACDLGLPWHIWMPIIHWQHHSVLFEIAWCVMLYTTVLILEFSPVALEHAWFQKPFFQKLAFWLKRLTLPIVITGIVLSTIHHSSLGSLFLIVPFRLHPLWYSPLLPVLFFISAVALGLMMLTLMSFISAYLFDHPLRLDLLAGLGRAAAWALWLYLAMRLGDLVWRGMLPASLDGSWYSLLFWFEIGLSTLLPAGLLSWPKIRSCPAGLLTCAGLVVSGIVLNRLAVGSLVMFQTLGTFYFPSWIEFAVSTGIVAGAGLVFLFLAENLNVLGPVESRTTEQSPYTRPVFDPETGVYQGWSWWDKAARRSLVLVPAAALAIALLPAGGPGGRDLAAPVKAAQGWTVMQINGNRDKTGVSFEHLDHQQRLAGPGASPNSACPACHHLNKPNDEATACWECHQNMSRPTSIFDHSLHQAAMGGNSGCAECHVGEHTARTAKACGECHDNMLPQAGETVFNSMAPGYQAALHGTCLACHEQEAQVQARPELAHCPACHKSKDGLESPQLETARRQ